MKNWLGSSAILWCSFTCAVLPVSQPAQAGDTLHVVSSMATREVLQALSKRFEAETGHYVQLESVGGVDAEARVGKGETFDVVILASGAIVRLIAAGKLTQGSERDIARSGIAIAVPVAARKPDISSEAAVRQAVLDASHIGYSTGPSGIYLQGLFKRWKIDEQVAEKTVVPKPGTPVGALIADGQVDLGFQQLSELINVDGITVVGSLPPEIQKMTRFTAGIPKNSAHTDVAQRYIEFLTSKEAAAEVQANGMQPAL